MIELVSQNISHYLWKVNDDFLEISPKDSYIMLMGINSDAIDKHIYLDHYKVFINVTTTGETAFRYRDARKDIYCVMTEEERNDFKNIIKEIQW